MSSLKESFGKLLNRLRKADTSKQKSAISRIASMSAGAIGTELVPSTVGTISDWIEENPLKSMATLNIMLDTGIEIAREEIADFFTAIEPEIMKLAPEEATDARLMIKRAFNYFQAEREALVGDGIVGSTHGIIETKDTDQIVANMVVSNAIIGKAIDILGSFEAVQTLQAAVLLETTDYDNFRLLNLSH